MQTRLQFDNKCIRSTSLTKEMCASGAVEEIRIEKVSRIKSRDQQKAVM